jgi:hypothetical protein
VHTWQLCSCILILRMLHILQDLKSNNAYLATSYLAAAMYVYMRRFKSKQASGEVMSERRGEVICAQCVGGYRGITGSYTHTRTRAHAHASARGLGPMGPFPFPAMCQVRQEQIVTRITTSNRLGPRPLNRRKSINYKPPH